MLGAAQLAWLKSALASSTAPVKLIAVGSQVLNRANRFEGWHDFATEQRAFLDFLVAQRIDGVIFLTGDRHFGELLRVERAGAPPLYEFTSSPLTSSPYANPDARERENPDLVPGTLIGRRQFGMIRIAGPGNDRTIELSSHDSAGNELWRHSIRARDLAFPRSRSEPPQ
jgi:alkaline phosphatase D